MNKELKMKLLEELMEEMDGSIAGKLKPQDEVQVTEVEQKEMPIEDVKDMIMEKMSGADVEDEGEMDLRGSMEDEEEEDDLEIDDDGEEEIEDGDIPYPSGRIADKLKALKKLKGQSNGCILHHFKTY